MLLIVLHLLTSHCWPTIMYDANTLIRQVDRTGEYMLFGGITLVCLVAIGVVLFVLFYQKKYTERQVAYREMLLRAAIALQERDRQRIGLELHDGVGALLATAKLQVHRLTEEGGSTEKLWQVEKLLKQSIQEVRTISRGLSQRVVVKFGLSEALKDYCQALEENTVVTLHSTIAEVPATLDFQVAISTFRIAQELLNNAIKHGQPNTIMLTLTVQDGNWLQLTVQDDGRGFNLSEVERQGIGLLNIQSRLNLIKGRIEQKILSTPGSCIVVSVPLPLPACNVVQTV